MIKRSVIGLTILVCCSLGWGGEYYVSVRGSDSYTGTKVRPFATLERARDALRGQKEKGGTVWIREGVFLLERSLYLGSEDSGVSWRAYNGESVRLVGGRVVNASDFQPVTDAGALSRIKPEVRGAIVQLDLKKLNIVNIDKYPDKFNDNGGIIELFCNDQRMSVSVYPNEYGSMTMKRVLVNGGGQEVKGSWGEYYSAKSAEERKKFELGPPRPGVFEYGQEHYEAHQRWAKVLDRGVWMKGYWRVVWQNETVRVAGIDTEAHTVKLAVPVGNGIGSKYHRPAGSGQEVYWVMNLLEEVDAPGEWAIDFADRKLYFYPPARLEGASILISDMSEPVITVQDAEGVSLIGLTVEGSLSSGIRINGARGNSVLGCTVRNVAKYAVEVNGGFEHEVRSCDLYSLGAGGVGLSGGNGKVTPRVKAGHRVVNNDIHHFGQIERVYAPGVNVGFKGGGGGSAKTDAVGMYVAHNSIHHCPHAGVLFNSFDNVFEYNEVFQYCMVSNDMGAFYSYAKEGGIGYETFRYNFMYCSPEGDGIYYDNITYKPKIYGNIAYKLGPRNMRKHRGFAYLIKNFSKEDFEICNNIAVMCKTGYDIWNVGAGCVSRNNISFMNLKDADNAGKKMPGVYRFEKDPGFVDMDRLDFRLKDDADVFKKVPGFERIPFGKIGLFVDEYRKTVPDYRKDYVGWSRREDKDSGYAVMDR